MDEKLRALIEILRTDSLRYAAGAYAFCALAAGVFSRSAQVSVSLIAAFRQFFASDLSVAAKCRSAGFVNWENSCIKHSQNGGVMHMSFSAQKTREKQQWER